MPKSRDAACSLPKFLRTRRRRRDPCLPKASSLPAASRISRGLGWRFGRRAEIWKAAAARLGFSRQRAYRLLEGQESKGAGASDGAGAGRDAREDEDDDEARAS